MGDGPRKRIWRFPDVRQIDEMDCGAASLAMVCRHFGRAVSLARIRTLDLRRPRRHEPARHLRRRRGARPRGPRGEGRAASTSTGCRCRPSSTGTATTGCALPRQQDARARRRPGARAPRAAARTSSRSGGAGTRRSSTTPTRSPTRPSRAARHRWLLPFARPFTRPARAGARPRGRRERAADAPPGLHAGHRRPRARRPERRRCSGSCSRGMVAVVALITVAMPVQRYLAELRGGPHRRGDARLPHAAAARAADDLLLDAAHGRHPAPARRRAAGARAPRAARHRRGDRRSRSWRSRWRRCSSTARGSRSSSAARCRSTCS